MEGISKLTIYLNSVIPAKAGIPIATCSVSMESPACTGMTI